MLKSAWKILLVGLLTLLGLIGGYLWWLQRQPLLELQFAQPGKNTPRRLDAYTFDRLASMEFPAAPLRLERVLYERPEFTAWVFSTQTALGQTVSGVINIPQGSGPFPVVVLLRGYVEKEQYRPGLGTRGAADAFARNGIIGVAPDFLGYGSSDPESFDVFETRFEKPLTVLSVLAGLSTLPQADLERVGLWGHSNGGQIAFSVLQITGKSYPTALWAPVTLGFPESVTAFFPELPDKGAYLQKQLDDEFFWRYNAKDYSISDHWERIRAPLIIHQGGKDTLVTPTQTEATIALFKQKNISVRYTLFPQENHLFSAGFAPQAAANDLRFFREHWEKQTPP